MNEKDPAMRDDYLWDGSGEPDAEVQKLETLLGRYRHDQPAPAFDQVADIQPPKHRWTFARLRFSLPFQLGAVAAILVIGIAGVFVFRTMNARNAGSAWEIARISGAPRVGWHSLRENSAQGKLGVGQTLVTDNSSRASIALDETGRIEVDPNSRLRLLRSGPEHKRLSLERGTIRATIWSPPGEFVVDTPSAVAVDLGCVYTLHVDGDGNGELHTSLGWVGFKFGERESFIPAGAMSSSKKNSGPGTPYFEDASPSFRAALPTLDFEEGS